MEWLTWQGIRAFATCEALVPRSGTVRLAEPDPQRPPIKWASQQHWHDTAIPKTPRPGEIIYARTAWRHTVRGALVRAVTAPSVLVSTFYDPMILSKAAAAVLDSSIQRWFGVQVMARHPKLTAMPVGVEAEHLPLYQATAQRAERDILFYMNFTDRLFMQIHPIRRLLWQHFIGRSWVTAEQPGDPAHYVRQLGRSRFVLSPPGYGWDCYRTYEAIVMGAIPILRRDPPASDVCRDLPVLWVDDWRELTPERLQHEWDTRRPGDLRTMTLPYWRDRIQEAAARCRA